jgi:5-formyltetrahydrofolate cyclo-ligase
VDSKATLKQKIRKQIKAQNLSQKEALSLDKLSNLHAHLVRFLKTQQGIWSGYFSLADEPNIDAVIKECAHLDWCFPRVESDQLSFYKSDSQHLQKSAFGMLEPQPLAENFIPTEQIQGLLIPGLAFSPTGVRLGRGKGYYDKTLKQFKNQKVGIGWDHQIIADLPLEDHDIKMDQVMTPLGILFNESVR